VARSARQRIKGLDPAPTEGVRVEVARATGSGTVELEVDVVISGQDQAAAVARAVQRAVARAVSDATGLTVAAVSVSILDIHIPLEVGPR
jgi:uncharacterized alkaline shock family protein YloU